MKFFLLILAVISRTYAEEEWRPKNAAEVNVIRQECLKDFPLSEEELQKVKNFEYSDEEPARKVLLCTVKKLGVFCERDGYNVDRVTKQFKMDLDEAEALSIVEGCMDKNLEGSSADVWAYRGHECVVASKIGERVKAYFLKNGEKPKK
ncbi:PREDICTED: general odorant-binding protein 99a-like [Bactrocera latifrons]|uniref:general odorant-binding protein 99a-like n=1 Tax=Bactrocera latifrons TaxID=174628 RepID=UPI0008DCD452|nr:PREDICTED: general odorant-binding protein 99a-like [Bactrocera latifrons]